MKIAYVYIMTNKRYGTLYTGVTSNLIQRVWQHKNKITPGFTSKYNLHKLVYYEQYGNILEAIKREKNIQAWKRQWKIRIIEEFNPDWSDLYDFITY